MVKYFGDTPRNWNNVGRIHTMSSFNQGIYHGVAPGAGRRAPGAGRRAPGAGRRSMDAGRHAPVACLNSPVETRRSEMNISNFTSNSTSKPMPLFEHQRCPRTSNVATKRIQTTQRHNDVMISRRRFRENESNESCLQNKTFINCLTSSDAVATVPFKCEYCGLSFKWESSLRKHVRFVHFLVYTKGCSMRAMTATEKISIENTKKAAQRHIRKLNSVASCSGKCEFELPPSETPEAGNIQDCLDDFDDFGSLFEGEQPEFNVSYLSELIQSVSTESGALDAMEFQLSEGELFPTCSTSLEFEEENESLDAPSTTCPVLEEAVILKAGDGVRIENGATFSDGISKRVNWNLNMDYDFLMDLQDSGVDYCSKKIIDDLEYEVSEASRNELRLILDVARRTAATVVEESRWVIRHQRPTSGNKELRHALRRGMTPWWPHVARSTTAASGSEEKDLTTKTQPGLDETPSIQDTSYRMPPLSPISRSIRKIGELQGVLPNNLRAYAREMDFEGISDSD